MYARDANGRTLTLAVSGMLWGKSLVMVDEETGSLWNHSLGEAMQGPLEGTVLEIIPSVMTDWKTWTAKYPETTVLLMSKTARKYRSAVHVQAALGDGSPHRESLVIGVNFGAESKCWDFAHLRRHPALNDEFAGKKLLVVYRATSGTAILYSRMVGGRALTFAQDDGKLIDRETGSRWDPLSGKALTPPLKGSQLQKLPGIVSLADAWERFHPETAHWKPPPKTAAESNEDGSQREGK